jgi:hypothetical protein
MERDRRRNPLHLEDDEARDLQRLKGVLPCERDEIGAMVCSAERVSDFERRGYLAEEPDWRATGKQFVLEVYCGQGRLIKKLALTGLGKKALCAYYRAHVRRL